MQCCDDNSQVFQSAALPTQVDPLPPGSVPISSIMAPPSLSSTRDHCLYCSTWLPYASGSTLVRHHTACVMDTIPLALSWSSVTPALPQSSGSLSPPNLHHGSCLFQLPCGLLSWLFSESPPGSSCFWLLPRSSHLDFSRHHCH